MPGGVTGGWLLPGGLAMSTSEFQLLRMKQLLMSTADKPQLYALKRMVRNWQTPGAPGQDAINRAAVRALDEIQNRLDAPLKV